MIAEFSEQFGLHPDDVYARTSFNTVAAFREMRIRQQEFADRYQAAEKRLKQNEEKDGH